jgi:hypothetical protein
MGVAADRTMTSGVIIHPFSGRSPAARAPEGPDRPEDKAALAQFTLERLMAYGVHHPDAVELRGRVTAGEAWQAAATDLAADCLAPPEASVAPASAATEANRYYRASALLRMSQVMMLSDDDQRRDIFARAADLYRRAAALTGDREPVIVETEQGPLSGWWFPRRGGNAVGCAVVIGGLEAWAMDFDALGLELAHRNVDTLVVDGPGQGESRMAHRHYLTKSWLRSYQGVFDHLAARTGGAPLAVVGNSLGGATALRLASQDARILACCDNCGPKAIGRPPPNVSLPGKLLAFCGDVAQEAAVEILQTLNPMAAGAAVSCPLLIVRSLFDWAESIDKQMVIYSDGDHCVYNHSDDKHNLIADWVADRLGAPNK